MHSVTIHSHSAQHVFQGMVLMLLNYASHVCLTVCNAQPAHQYVLCVIQDFVLILTYASHVRLAVHNAQPAHQHVLCVMQVIMRILVPVMIANLDAPVALIVLYVLILQCVQIVLINIEYITFC